MTLTIPQQFSLTAQKYPHKTALRYKRAGSYRDITFAELEEDIKKLSSFLLSKMKEGERAGILSENRPEWVMADLAVMSCSCVTVPLHTTLSPAILQYIITDAQVKIIFTANQALVDKLLAFKSQLPFALTIIAFDKLNLADQEVFYLADILRRPSPEQWPATDNQASSIVYTSGTTGNPKGVLLTHHNFLSNAQAALEAVPVYHSDTLLSFLPLSHVLERTAGYYAPLVCQGATIAYAESLKTLPQDLREARPTILICVPRIFEKMYEKIWQKVKNGPKFKKTIFYWALSQTGGWRKKLADCLVFKKIRRQLGGRLRFVISGGASLNPKIAKFFEHLGIKIIEGYGLTETAPVLCVNRLEKYKFGTVGQPVKGVKIKISPDKEILAKGPNVMNSYYKPESHDQPFDEEGWFKTGDLGYLDNEGFLTIIGRKKEMIVTSGGKNISPEKLENALNLNKYISQSLVIGDNLPYLSALIVPDQDNIKKYAAENHLSAADYQQLLSLRQIISYLEAEIKKALKDCADYEQIKKFTLIPEEFTQEKEELTPTLKLRREVIREHYRKAIEGMY